MTTYKWLNGKLPNEISVKQVYGIVFASDGKVLLRVEDNKYKLTGGKPQNVDSNMEETLKREYLEELNITIEDIHYLGYLLVEEKGEKYAQVRMIARINNIGENRPDIDNGKLYKRFMTNQENTKEYLKYPDEAGNQMIDDAIKLANEKYNFESSNNKEEYFI